jgi:hypothetical protein
MLQSIAFFNILLKKREKSRLICCINFSLDLNVNLIDGIKTIVFISTIANISIIIFSGILILCFITCLLIHIYYE